MPREEGVRIVRFRRDGRPITGWRRAERDDEEEEEEAMDDSDEETERDGEVDTRDASVVVVAPARIAQCICARAERNMSSATRFCIDRRGFTNLLRDICPLSAPSSSSLIVSGRLGT